VRAGKEGSFVAESAVRYRSTGKKATFEGRFQGKGLLFLVGRCPGQGAGDSRGERPFLLPEVAARDPAAEDQ